MQKQDFIGLVVERVPQAFFTDVFQRVGFAIDEARSSVRDDTRFDRQEWVQIEGQNRYAMVFKQFRRAADTANLECADYGVSRGAFCYPVVTCKPFMLTISAIEAVNELPVASEYRAGMAEVMNAAWTRPKLRATDREALTAVPLYGIVVYTVPRVEGMPGYVGLGFPDPAYSRWLALLSREDLMSGYAASQIAEPAATPDLVQPTLRLRQEKRTMNEPRR